VDLTDLWSWPDIPRFQKQSVFDLILVVAASMLPPRSASRMLS
jgi:hypothetical protein